MKTENSAHSLLKAARNEQKYKREYVTECVYFFISTQVIELTLWQP